MLPSLTVSLFTRQAKEDVDAYASHTGVDLDIEGGSSAHYAVFVNEIRSLASGASKKWIHLLNCYTLELTASCLGIT